MSSPPFTFYGATAIYLSSHFLIHFLSSNFRLPYLHSEWLCWLFLLLAAKLNRPSTRDNYDANIQPDRLALAIAAVGAFRTIGDVNWALVCPSISLTYPPADLCSKPLLTPLSLLIVHQTPHTDVHLESLEKAQPAGTVSYRRLFASKSTLAFGFVPAILSAAWLLPVPYSGWQICTGLSFGLVLMVVYMLIHDQKEEPFLGQEADRISLPSPAISWRALAVLTMMLLIGPKSFLPTKFSEPLTLVVVALLKAIQWVMVMELVSLRYSGWRATLTA